MTTATLASPARTYIPYGRVSRKGDRQGDRYISVPEQRRKVERAAQTYELELLEEFFLDENYSGSTVDRPAFQRALALIEAGEAAGIVVGTFDRFSRDTVGALVTIGAIEAVGGKVFCGDVGQVSKKDDRLLYTTIHAAMGEQELIKKTQYLSDTRRNAIERGVHLAVPYGYRREGGRGTKLVAHDVEAPVVRRAFAMRAAGDGWARIVIALNDAGVMPRPAKRGGVERNVMWTHSAVQQMIHKEVYLGVAHSGEYRHEGAHEALVDLRTWKAANESRGARRAGPSTGYLLSGLVRCAGCGRAMVHFTKGAHRYYRCPWGEKGRSGDPCPAGPYANADDLESMVTFEFKRSFLDEELVAEFDDEAVSLAQADADNAEALVKRMMKRYLTLEGDDVDEQAAARELLDEAKAAKRAADAALGQARRAARLVAIPDDVDADAFDTLPVQEQRHLLGLAYACVVVWPAVAWREPVAQRTRLVTRDDAPSTTPEALIGMVATLER